jgi:hypothetical protein
VTPDSESIDVGRVTTVGLTVDERIEVALELVRAFWAESPSEVAEDALTQAELRLNIALPHALREGYRRLLASRGMNTQDRFVPLHELVVERGHLTFRVENQGCAAWAVRIDDDPHDPGVWIRSAHSEWCLDAGPLSSFFVFAALSEAIFGPPNCANAEVVERQLEQLESNFRQVDVEAFAYWPDPTIGCRFFGDVGTLIADHAGAWLWAASLSSTGLSRVTELITTEWTID